MSPLVKEAIITGITSGIGLATCQALSQRPEWEIYILDLRSSLEAARIKKVIIHELDITNYDAHAAAFKAIFQRHKRLDFVYTNAGIGEHNNSFYAKQSTGLEKTLPVPAHALKVIDICMTAAVTTVHVAQHYFRQSPSSTRGERILVFTASCGALYPSYGSPVYTATKHGVLGFMRSVAPFFWRDDGVRCNAALPGTVKTNLLSEDSWKQFPVNYFTPVEKVVETVTVFVGGKDAQNPDVKVMVGLAIECSGHRRYYIIRTQCHIVTRR